MLNVYTRKEEPDLPLSNKEILSTVEPACGPSQTDNRGIGIGGGRGDGVCVEVHEPKTTFNPEPPGNDQIETEHYHPVPWYRSPVIIGIAGLALAIGLFHLINQVAQFFSAIQNSWWPLRYAGYFAALALSLLFVWALFKLTWVFLRLRSNPAFSNTNLSQHDRSQLQSLVEDYPLNDASTLALLRDGKVNLDDFYRDLQDLAERSSLHDIHWVEDFKSRYCNPLEQCAQQVVHSYALSVGIKTAVVPNGLLDTLIIWTNAILMLERLCRVYNLRPNRFEVVCLSARLVFTTFVVARIDDAINGLAGDLGNSAQEGAKEFGKDFAHQFTDSSTAMDAIGSVVGGGANLLTKFAGKAAEGTVTYMFFRRLGYAAIRSLQPIRK